MLKENQDDWVKIKGNENIGFICFMMHFGNNKKEDIYILKDQIKCLDVLGLMNYSDNLWRVFFPVY